MLQPVSPTEFYQSDPGILFMQTVASVPSDPFGIFTPDHIESAQKQARLDVCAKWLTGNYDPVSNTHTLYRGVDDTMLDDFNQTGTLTSRLVRVFGDGDVSLAEKTLRKAAKGKIIKHLKNNAELALAKSEEYLDKNQVPAPASLDSTRQLLRGKPSENTQALLLKKAKLLRIIQAGGKEAYLAAVKEADNDDVPPTLVGSLYGLTHSSIHLTTDPEFLTNWRNTNWFTHVLKVQFIPGILPLAPNVGYADGRYVLPEKSPSIMEREWYGVGQLKPIPGQISIEYDATHS